jgi:hypothetical protein
VSDFDEGHLSSINMDWWVKYQIGRSPSFSVSYTCAMEPGVDAKELGRDWDTALERQKILRSYYRPCETFGARRQYHEESP